MKYFTELKNKVRSDVLTAHYNPPKNAIARIKYHVYIKEVISELYNEYVENLANVYIFVSRHLPLSLSWEITTTKGWQRFIKRMHVTDFSLMYREVYGVYGVNACQCKECLNVLANRSLKTMSPPYAHYFDQDECDYLSRKAHLEKLSKTERMYASFVHIWRRGSMGADKGLIVVAPEVDISKVERELDAAFIKDLKSQEPLNIFSLKCPHAKAMVFIKAKTKKGN